MAKKGRMWRSRFRSRYAKTCCTGYCWTCEEPFTQSWRRARWWISGRTITCGAGELDSFAIAEKRPECGGWKYRINMTPSEGYAPTLPRWASKAETEILTKL